jgi:hypothetical protein
MHFVIVCGGGRQEHGADGVIHADTPENKNAIRKMMFR